MQKYTKALAGFALASIVGIASATAQDGGLLDLLLRKGMITDQEAEDIRADMGKDQKVTTSTETTTKIRIAGDVRVRYQYDNEVTNISPAATGNDNDRSRYRYRLRLALVAALADGWTAGIRMETASGATSTNDDFGAAGSTNFAKNDNTVFVGQAYLQYVKDLAFNGAIDKIDVRIGKHAHTFFNPGVNGFWIDSDINFEGVSEDLLFANLGGGDLALNVRGGQYLLSNNSRTTNAAGGFLNSPSMMYVLQTMIGRPKVWSVAPTFVYFDSRTLLGTAANSDAANYDNMVTFILPAEYIFQVAGKPLAVYGTYGINFEGKERTQRFYGINAVSSYDQMFNFGLRYGQSKNKRDYQLVAEYRYVEPGAYTSILLDSDFNGGRTNGSGYILSGSYNFSDAVNGTITFFRAENVDPNSPAAVGFHKADVLQIDLAAKF